MKRFQQQRGFTLIEALVAFIVLSVGLIGTVAMQAVAKRNSYDAMQRAQALAIASDIIERMRANKQSGQAFLAGYNGNYGTSQTAIGAPNPLCRGIAANCNAAEMMVNDQFEWSQRLLGADVTRSTVQTGGMVDAVGCINMQANGNVTVVVAWQGRESIRDAATSTGELTCGTAGDTRRQVVVSTFIY